MRKLLPDMRVLIVDLEATCWHRNGDNSKMETIEIGAVMMSPDLSLPAPEYQRFVRPFTHPILSDFCVALTSIQQQDVDAAGLFVEVFPDFVEWIGDAPFLFCSWGDYDYAQLKRDCGRVGLAFPESFENHLNLKKLFKTVHKKRVGMTEALAMLGLPLEGTHHRGIDDARNIARIARVLFAKIASPTN